MVTAYKGLAHGIVGFVMLQAAWIALAVFGLGTWIEEGGVADKAMLEADTFAFPEAVGFMLHGMLGMMLIPVLALALLVVSFFTKVPGAPRWAAIVLGVTVLQVLLGLYAHSLPALGALHGLNAFVLVGVAFKAGASVRTSATQAASQQSVSV